MKLKITSTEDNSEFDNVSIHELFLQQDVYLEELALATEELAELNDVNNNFNTIIGAVKNSDDMRAVTSLVGDSIGEIVAGYENMVSIDVLEAIEVAHEGFLSDMGKKIKELVLKIWNFIKKILGFGKKIEKSGKKSAESTRKLIGVANSEMEKSATKTQAKAKDTTVPRPEPIVEDDITPEMPEDSLTIDKLAEAKTQKEFIEMLKSPEPTPSKEEVKLKVVKEVVKQFSALKSPIQKTVLPRSAGLSNGVKVLPDIVSAIQGAGQQIAQWKSMDWIEQSAHELVMLLPESLSYKMNCQYLRSGKGAPGRSNFEMVRRDLTLTPVTDTRWALMKFERLESNFERVSGALAGFEKANLVSTIADTMKYIHDLPEEEFSSKVAETLNLQDSDPVRSTNEGKNLISSGEFRILDILHSSSNIAQAIISDWTKYQRDLALLIKACELNAMTVVSVVREK